MNYGKAKYVAVLPVLMFVCYIFFLVFSGSIILPQTFKIGPLTVHYYGIFMALAVASGFYLAIKRASKYGLEVKPAEDILFWLIVGGFIGARLYHVASSFQYYFAHPIDVIKVWNGGLSIYGALLGGIVAILVFKKLATKNYPLTTILDWLAPSLALGQIIGRFGNFFNYEVLGYPTNLPWKMFVPEQFRPQEYLNFHFFHPFFLYEAIGSAIILLLLLKVIEPKLSAKAERNSKTESFGSSGSLFFFYLLLYNVLRFGLEFLRTDSTFVSGFRLNALVSLIVVIASACWLILNNKHDKVS